MIVPYKLEVMILGISQTCTLNLCFESKTELMKGSQYVVVHLLAEVLSIFAYVVALETPAKLHFS